MKYWIIKWDATQGRSSRKFETFLSPKFPHEKAHFEAYGFNNKDGAAFRWYRKVKIGDHVFCYQAFEDRYVAKCEVKEKDPKAPGGRSLVLVKISDLNDLRPKIRKGQWNILPLEDEKEIARLKAKCNQF